MPTLETSETLKDYDPTLDRVVRLTVRRKSEQLIQLPVFQGEDRLDLEQELLAHALQSLEHFDPSIGALRPYIITVIDRHGRNLTRKRRANKRLAGLPLASLNIEMKSEDGGRCELSQLVQTEDGDRRLARERRFTDEQLSDLRHDLAAVISKLPEPWKEVLEHSKSLTPSEISKVMGVPRSTLSNWMKQIQERFLEAGLDNYFEK